MTVWLPGLDPDLRMGERTLLPHARSCFSELKRREASSSTRLPTLPSAVHGGQNVSASYKTQKN